MPTREYYFEDGSYLDPLKLLNVGSSYRVDDILNRISFKDVEELLSFSDAPELIEIAKKHSFFRCLDQQRAFVRLRKERSR